MEFLAKSQRLKLGFRKTIFPTDNMEKSEIVKKSVSLSLGDVDLAAYIRPWMNFCYYILFLPFKIEWDGTTHYINTNLFQKILCGILHPVICFNAVFEVRETFVAKVRENPEVFMRALERSTTVSLLYLFMYTVWWKSNTILALCNLNLNHNPKINQKNMNWKVRLCCCVLLTFSLHTFALYNLFVVRHNSTWGFGFQQLAKKFGIIYLRHDGDEGIGIGNENKSEVRVTAQLVIGTVGGLIPRVYKWAMVDFVISLNAITGLLSYKLAKTFKQILIQPPGIGRGRDDEKLETYSKLKESFNGLNEFIGPISLVVFLFTITFCAVNVADVLDSETWGFSLLGLSYISFTSTAMILAAEAHYQAGYFKMWVLADRGRYSSYKMNYLEAEEWNVGIRGGRFFTITYGFLGTASSVILTYTVIMIQFGGATHTTHTTTTLT